MQRFASVKTLVSILNITNDVAWQIRNVIKNPNASLAYNVEAWIPSADGQWVEFQMTAINRLLGMYGYETIHLDDEKYIGKENFYNRNFWLDCILLYCNTGETYQPTIGYEVRTNKFILLPSGWGTWHEKNVKPNY